MPPSRRSSRLLLVLTAACLCLVPGALGSSARSSIPRENERVGSRAALLTRQLERLAETLRAGGGDHARVTRRLVRLSRLRRRALVALLERHPYRSARLILPADVRHALRTVPGAAVESPVTLRGTFRIWHRDDFEHPSRGVLLDQLVTPSGKAFTLHAADSRVAVRLVFARLTPNAPMSVRGYTLGGRVLATGLRIRPVRRLANSVSSSASTTGPVATAVIVGTFADSTTPVDLDAIRANFQGSPGHDVLSYFSGASYGKMTVAPSFFGPFALPTASSTGCSLPPTQSLVDAAASTVSFAQFSRLVFVYNCPRTAFASATSIGPVSTPQGTVQAAQITLDARSAAGLYPVVHELSHTLGGFNMHAAFDVCLPETFVPPSRFDDGCASAEYGDPFDALGGPPTGWVAQLDPFHKANAGWFDTGQFPTVSGPGTYTYTLAPYESPTSGILALNVPRGQSGTAFTVEYRQPVGFDAWMASSTICPGCTVTQGASIRLVAGASGSGGGSDTQLLDTTPGTIPTTAYYPVDDARDSALLPGRTFTDPEYGISITAVSADSSGLTVRVTVPDLSCVRGAPAVSTPSPSTQTGAAGRASVYAVTLTNTDSPGCQPNTFRYFPPSSSVVSVVASPDFLTLAPGASATVSLGVAALPTATTGSYVFTSASDGAGTFRSNSLGTGDAVVSGLTYQLGAPADTAAPTAPTGATARALGSGSVALAWSAASDNVGVFGYRVNRGGVLLTSIGTSLVDAGVAPATAYTYSIQAFDRQGNLSPAVTVSVTTPARTDFSPPTAPVVTAEAGDHSLSVSWSASSDNVGVAYYRIYPCLVPGCLVPADVRTFTVGGLPTRTKVNVQVLAVDGDDNPSSFSLGTYPVYTAAAGTIAPSQPRHLVSPAGSFGHVELSWAPSSDDRGVDHYAVYRNNRRIATVTTTSYTDTLVRCASEYYVQAVDADGSLSAPSDRVWFSPPPSPATDSSPPSAGLIAPADGSTVSGTIAVGAIASDDVGVTNAQLYVDGVFKGSSTSTPSSFTWDTTSVPDGVHWLYVRAYDAAGNYGTAGVAELTVHNGGGADAALPKVSILAPTTGTVVPDSVALSATASDSTGVTSVQFSVDGAPAAVATEAPYEFTWDASGSSQGSHTITATADDAAGNSASATVIVLRPVPSDPPAPAVSITAPTNGATVSGLIQVQASASDSVGVTGVELSVDGAVRGKRTVDPWSFSIDTTKLTNGSHAVAVTAYDAAGNSSSAQVTVSVQNAAADTTPPKAPSNLKASSIGTTQITLSWTASTDNVGVVGYDVYRDGTLIGQSLRPGSIDTGLSPATTHVYVVRARDAAGNTSAASSALTAKTNGLPSPSSLKAAVVGTTQVAFFWTPSTASAGIVGYDIYRDGVMIGRASLPNYLDSGLAPGTSHVYVVRARDAAGNRSAASSGISTKTAAISASTTGTVAGVFYDQQGKPLANAVVQLTGNGVSKSSKTNGSGSYTFSFLTPGTYSIAIRPPGTFAAPLLTADSGSATVISGQTTVLVATDME